MARQTKKPKKSQRLAYKLWLLIGLISVLLTASFFTLGYTVASNNANNSQETVKTMHSHTKYEVSQDEPKPKISSLELTKDSKSGWNLNIKTENFEFAPEQVNQEHMPGKGHAHLYIDGVKITRVYSNYYYIAGYNEGIHDLTVTLNTNSHSDYYIDGKQVSYSVKMVGDHGHSEGTPQEHQH